MEVIDTEKPKLVSVDTMRESERKKAEFASERSRRLANQQAEFEARYCNFAKFLEVARNEKADGVVTLELVRLFKQNATDEARESQWGWDLSMELLEEYSRDGDVNNKIEYF